MIPEEGFLDRLLRQKGWDLSGLSKVTLALCGCGLGATMTLSLAAVSSGITQQVLIGPDGERDLLWGVADRVMEHLGYHSEYIPVHSVGFSSLRKRWGTEKRVWIH